MGHSWPHPLYSAAAGAGADGVAGGGSGGDAVGAGLGGLRLLLRWWEEAGLEIGVEKAGCRRRWSEEDKGNDAEIWKLKN